MFNRAVTEDRGHGSAAWRHPRLDREPVADEDRVHRTGQVRQALADLRLVRSLPDPQRADPSAAKASDVPINSGTQSSARGRDGL